MSAFDLKIIALVAMFIDHFAVIFGWRLELVSEFVPMLRMVGRLTFPIFVYFIGVGFRHTSDIHKYLMRLGIFAIISEIPFDIALRNARTYPEFPIVWLEFGRQNVFFTLFLGLLAAYIFKKVFEDWRYAIVLPLPFAGAIFVNADFGIVGMVMVFACAVLNRKAYQLAAIMIGGLMLHRHLDGSMLIMMNVGYVVAIGLIALYSGRQGPRMKWMFYAFYPLHFLVLFGLLMIYEAFV